MVYNGYYKVMSNIPKMGHLTTPASVNWDHHLSKKTSASATWTAAISFLWLYDHCHILQPSKETSQEASYEDQNDEYPWTIDKKYIYIYICIHIYIYIYILYTYIYIYTYILFIYIYMKYHYMTCHSFPFYISANLYGFLKMGPFFHFIYHQWCRWSRRAEIPRSRQPLSAKSFTIRMTSRLHPAWKSRENHGSLVMSPLNITQPLDSIRYMVYNGYYKVMSNIPKMGHLTTPENLRMSSSFCSESLESTSLPGLVNIYKKLLKMTIYSGFTHEK